VKVVSLSGGLPVHARRLFAPGAANFLFGRFVLPMLACATLLSGCIDVNVPDYKRPDTPAKTEWSKTAKSLVSPADTITLDWWKQFHDPYLDSLVSKAIAGNFDIKILAARVSVAGGQISEARAGALPTADLGAGAQFDKTTGQNFSKQFNVATQVNWDIDIWGAVEKGVQAQKAEYHASEADWRAGYLTLVSDVSTTYFQILQFDDQIVQQQKTLLANQQILTIFLGMEKNGLVPHTQVLTQRAEINRLTKELLELHRSRDLANNALSTLIGVPAGEFTVPAGQLETRVQVPVVPAGLPAQLMARRPDVVAAEYRVLEAYDIVGQAKLAQLPTISLTGRGGTASFALTDLLKSFTFSFLPSINIPLLDPSVRAHVKTTEAQTVVVEQQYRRTVMGAFEEVENALVNLDAHTKQRKELQEEVDHLQIVAAQIDAQLKEGVISQLQVFETERTLLAAQLELLQNHQQLLSDTVTLYKSLGGGWQAVDVKDTKEAIDETTSHAPSGMQGRQGTPGTPGSSTSNGATN
jgi:outer membrane protein, multidrug efflux system